MQENPRTDMELWIAISDNDDTDAFNVLFERYWSRIFTTSFSYLRDKEACHEITHDIFLSIWLKRKQLKIGNFANYLKASARYHAYKFQKIQKAIPLQYRDDLEALNLVTVNDCDDHIRYSELESRIKHDVNDLPKRCAEIFILSRVEQLSNDEIAKRLQISKRTVENQITHALQHLRISLKDLTVLCLLCHYFKR